jgi:hypothetical protein
MEGEVIKSFLVGLGFSVDDSTLARFNQAIEKASLRVAALYASIKLSAAGIFAGISKVAQGFEDLGYQLRIVAPAVNRWLVMRQALLDAYARAGVNIGQVVKQAILFNYSLQKTKFALEAVYRSVAAKFFPILTKQMDIFRQKIFANMPKIQAALIKFVEFVFKAFDATVELGTRLWSILTRVWDFFVRLDQATNGWSTRILGVIAAWKLLNLEFLATPLGMLLAGLFAILALFDDFKVWQEGGKSLFDWSPFLPVIKEVSAAVDLAATAIGNLFQILFQLGGLIADVFQGKWQEALLDIKTLFSSIVDYAKSLIDYVKQLGNVGGALAGWAPSAANWVGNHLGLGSSTSVTPQANGPLLPANAGNNATIHQQTQINVSGAADANAVGKTVVNQQDRVNFDMTRNLKGAMQ